jgi:uncharacterized protein GlcG (DUF336 family)
MKKVALLIVALSCVDGNVLAGSPVPADSLQDSAAAELLTVRTLSLAQAMSAAAVAIKACTSERYLVSVAVVDRDGLVKVSVRGDGAPAYTLDAARRKAYTAASTGTATSQLEQALSPHPELWSARQIDGFLLLGGGLPVMIGTEIVGAIGVSGAPTIQADEACARAGLRAIDDRVKR